MMLNLKRRLRSLLPGILLFSVLPARVTGAPTAASYQVAPGLANVVNRKQFSLPKETIRLLETNACAAEPGAYREFFQLYEQNRYDLIPSFITTDALLHNYHLLFSFLLREVERNHLVAEATALTRSLLAQSQAQQRALKGTPWENAAARNTAFLAVAARLLDAKSVIPESVRPEVTRELALIAAHQGIAPSPVMNRGGGEADLPPLLEDYTQYIVRGHYEQEPKLRAYFQAMMWMGRITFRAKSLDETRSALLLTVLLARSGADSRRWERIYDPTAFFVGRSDDLSFPEYRDLMQQVYGAVPTGPLLRDETRLRAFQAAVFALNPPRINSLPVFVPALELNREQAIRGFRLMGQRYTLDAAIFQKLVFRAVGSKRGTLDPVGARYLPRGLDLPAALGSAEAYRILKEYGDTGYYRYPENMQRLRASLAEVPASQWTQNLYWSWLYALRPLLADPGASAPTFMRGQAWCRKDLNSFLGSWAELKHDTILYAKQVYAEMGDGAPEKNDDRGYVEPRPEVYARLAALSERTRRGLANLQLLSARDGKTLAQMTDYCRRLQAISEKELRGTALTAAEYDFIKYFGGNLEHFWLEALRDQRVNNIDQLLDHPAAVIADVATDPNGSVLQVGIGMVAPLYVVVPITGKLKLARGGIFSYYEFVHPMNDRLTDSKWREMLDAEKAPEPPSWTRAFLATR